MENVNGRRTRRAVAAVAVSVALAAAATGCTAPGGPGGTGTTSTTTSTTTPPAAGVTWRSGVNGDPVIDRRSVEAFCNWRGRACPVAMAYTARDDWDKMTTGSDWMFDNFAGFPGQLVISQGLTPNGHPRDRFADLQSCAAGQHDQRWRGFGTDMVSHGRGASIVRLGWEFNGTFMPWSAFDSQTYIDCYRHAAQAIRQTNPAVVLDWTINSHGTPGEACDGVSTNCYPGDDVVDIIGIDNYDQGPSAASAADFERIADRPDGLNWIYDFAVAHDKRFSVGEWGLAPGSDWNTHGENPQFIRWMYDWFRAHAADLEYEAYFNSCTANDVESNLWRPTGNGCVRVNTAGGALYQDLWAA